MDYIMIGAGIFMVIMLFVGLWTAGVFDSKKSPNTAESDTKNTASDDKPTEPDPKPTGSTPKLTGDSGTTSAGNNTIPAIPTRLYKPPDVSAVEFGGVYGVIDNVPVLNPSTNTSTCPDGFLSKQIRQAANLDYPLTFCYKEIDNPDTWTPSEGALEFGGMYGFADNIVTGGPINNIATKNFNCPAGFKDLPVVGGVLVGEKPLNLCYKKITDTDGWKPSAESLQFGGMFGFVDGKQATNPLTKDMTCPRGFVKSQVSGTNGVDWPVYYCAKPWEK